MSLIVVDTDVVSFLFRDDALSGLYSPILEGKQAVISFMSLAELALWPLKSHWSTVRVRRLRDYLDETFGVCFQDEKLCRLWAEVRYQGFTKGRPVSPSDAWIAATARYLSAPLVTHNEQHFRHLDRLEILTAAK